MRAHALRIVLAATVVVSCTRKDTPSAESPSLLAAAAAAGPRDGQRDGGATLAAKETMPPERAEPVGPAAPRLVGRFVRDGDGMRFAWPGSAILARFKGTGIAIRLKDEGANLFEVVIDGEVKKVLRTERTKDRYLLAEGLPDAVHDILVEKRTEARVGEAVFYGLEPTGKLLAPAPAPDRRIELIGDSITTGYGNEGPNATCTFFPPQQNEYLTYGAITARALSADHVTVAWSGKTLHEMRGYFDKALPARDGKDWDFAQYQPNVVVVNVGTNNFALIDPGEARFVRLYHELIEKVRAAYPKAFIVCALGPMLTDVYPEGHKNLTQARKYMRTVVAKLKEAGDTNLDLLEFPEQNHADGLGCGFHPSLKTHTLMADRLTAFLKERMGW